VSRQQPIEDYYGTEISVEVCGHSNGFMVDIDRAWTEQDPCAVGRAFVGRSGFDSLTAEQARELAGRLIAAAEEIEGHA
jgi:hypothetical protein